MGNFKFKYVSYNDILESPKGKHMVDAIEQPIEENLLINGLPGCGKSTIAMHRLDKFKNKKGILLTYGNLLTSYLKQSSKDEKVKNKIQGFWKWFYGERTKCRLPYVKIEDVDSYIIQETFEKIVEKEGQYDFIFIDEGQDLPKDIYSLLHILGKHINVFADDAQQLYGRNATLEDIVGGIDPIQYELNINRRNPKGLYEFAYQFNPKNAEKGNLKLMTNKTDPVEVYNCANKNQELEQILELLDEYNGKNIAILFTNQDSVNTFQNELEDKKISHTVYHSQSSKNLESFHSPLLTTFHSAKGLEFPIVIIPGLYPEHKGYKIEANHYFVAITRASEKVIITHHNGDSEIEIQLKKVDKGLYEEYKIGHKSICDDFDEIAIDNIPF